MEKNKTPWYESNLFWGPLGLAAAIVITATASKKPDLGWLLWLALPLTVSGVWAVFKHSKMVWIVTAVAALLVGLGLYSLSFWLRHGDSQTKVAEVSANALSKPPVAIPSSPTSTSSGSPTTTQTKPGPSKRPRNLGRPEHSATGQERPQRSFESEMLSLAKELDRDHPDLSGPTKAKLMEAELRKDGFNPKEGNAEDPGAVHADVHDAKPSSTPCPQGRAIIDGVDATGPDLIAGIKVENHDDCITISNVKTAGAKYAVWLFNDPKSPSAK